MKMWDSVLGEWVLHGGEAGGEILPAVTARSGGI